MHRKDCVKPTAALAPMNTAVDRSPQPVGVSAKSTKKMLLATIEPIRIGRDLILVNRAPAMGHAALKVRYTIPPRKPGDASGRSNAAAKIQTIR